MKIITRVCFLSIVIGLCLGGNAQAQQPYGVNPSFSLGGQSAFNRSTLGAGSRPAFSPYLNLLRRGNSTLSNYYGLVRPELDFRRADTQLRHGYGQIRGELRNQRDRHNSSNLPVSGHRVLFQSDLRGGPASVPQSLAERRGRLQGLPRNSGSRLAPTGHAVYFGNSAGFFSRGR
jgi:hypothetical protein